MLRIIKTVSTILFLLAALMSPFNMVSAEQLDKNVEEWFKSPDNSNELQEGKTTKEAKVTNETVGVTFWDFLRMIVATIFVVGLLYFLLKFVNRKSISYKSSQLVENLGGTSLGTNRSIQVVKTGGRVLIVGVGENIQLLKEIDEPEEVDQIIKEYNKKVDQLIQPSDLVTKLLKKSEQERRNGGTPFSTMLKDQLKDMSKGRKKMFEEMQKKGPDQNE